MGIFEQFPYTNFHDLNLDWILHAIRSMDKKLDEFVASNVLSYADPIQWDIETQYAKNTVVVDPKTGTAYMSINPVPVGQLLTNKYYWQPIFNYDEIVNTLKKQIAAVQADQHDIIHVAVGRGDLVWVANKLYRLTKSLDAGSKITENENAVPVTVEDAIINIDTTKNITRNTDGTITDTAGTITRNSDNIIDTANDAISVSGKTITNVAADSITNSSANITDTATAGIARNAATITDTATGDVTVSGRNITDTASAGIARNAATITDTASGDVSVSGENITDTASAGIARNAATITDTATGDVNVSGKNIIANSDSVDVTVSGIYNITSGNKKFNVIDTHNFVFATDYGVSESNDDNSDKLNELLANNDCVVLPRGTYKFTKPIEIFNNNATVIFIGTIQSTAEWAIKIKGVAQNVSARIVKGTNNGIQILDGDAASGGSVFTFDIIDAAKIGLELNCSHENSGIQACNFYLNRISYGTIGIHFICTSNGNWINQNVFENFWCFPKENNTGTGIKMEKGPGQTDKFNQNHFNNFSCEGCNLYVDLAFAMNNYFHDFRALENSGSRKLFKLASDTKDNEFRTSENLHFSDLDDQGTRNNYYARFYDENNVAKTDHIDVYAGFYYLFNGLLNKSDVVAGSKGVGLSDYITKFTIIPNADTTLILSPTYSNVETAPSFWIETGDVKTYKVTVELYNGQVVLDNLQGYKKYLCTPAGTAGMIYNTTIF